MDKHYPDEWTDGNLKKQMSCVCGGPWPCPKFVPGETTPPKPGPKTFTFDVYHPGEKAAGIIGFADTVKITVESGDPGGDATGEDSFQEFMLTVLKEWYDGAGVKIVS